MRKINRLLFCGILLLGMIVNLPSQAIPKEEYLKYIPLEYHRIIEQTEGSVELQIYGDINSPRFKDVNPLNGIDDRRDLVLKILALRFAPLMVQNTIDAPVDFFHYMRNQSSFPLHIDTWNIAAPQPELLNSDQIDFFFPEKSTCEPLNKKENNQDCKLKNLLKEFNPDHPLVDKAGNIKQSPHKDIFKVLYFDFPGESPESWKQAFKESYDYWTKISSRSFFKSYVHPFIHKQYDKDGIRTIGFELILQYWFFYPYNDGGNNHEGDWEHINVVVAPLNKIDQKLSENDILHMLNGLWLENPKAEEELVIRRIEYYFHHYIMPLDFSSPNVYVSRKIWEERLDNLTEERLGGKKLLKEIRYRAFTDQNETVINTHPVIYIGGDNKGLDQILQAPGGTNRDSHGSYPFSGMFKNIGPAGATEQIVPLVDHREYFGKNTASDSPQEAGLKRGNVIFFEHPEMLEIVPDWERISNLVLSDAGARRQWGWLILPIRWGYPATKSPFAGIIKHIDTGNVGDIGPAFWDGWNRSLATPEVHIYEPNLLPRIFPLRFQDEFDNSLGYLNLTYPVLLNLPPFDLVWRFAAYPIRAGIGRLDPVYYPEMDIPLRFFGFAAGASAQIIDPDYNNIILNQSQFEDFTVSVIEHFLTNGADSTTVNTGMDENFNTAFSPAWQLIFYMGNHFSTEHTLRNFKSRYTLDASFSNIPDYRYQGTMNFWEYSGSFRYSITASDFQPYIKLGYGWSWYRLEDVSVNSVPLGTPNSIWFNQPSFDSFGDMLPNTWQWGIGAEWIFLRNYGQFPSGIDLSLRAEYAVYYNKTGIDLSHISLENLALIYNTINDVPANSTVTRKNLNLILSLSF